MLEGQTWMQPKACCGGREPQYQHATQYLYPSVGTKSMRLTDRGEQWYAIQLLDYHTDLLNVWRDQGTASKRIDAALVPTDLQASTSRIIIPTREQDHPSFSSWRFDSEGFADHESWCPRFPHTSVPFCLGRLSCILWVM